VIQRDGWDILVVGAGGAGMTCAITAAQRGARVIVLEKTNEIGGTLLVAGGKLSAAGTRRQRERGIDDHPDKHFDDAMRLSKGTIDPVVVRLAVDEAPHTVDWLDDLGFPFDPETPKQVSDYQPYKEYGTPRLYWGPGPVTRPAMAQTILEAIRPAWDEQVAAGNIVVALEHRMQELLQDRTGAVTGVRTLHGDRTVDLQAGAVVLTTGGYGSSPELFAELTPGAPRLVSVARPSSTGDGLVAARAIGGVIRNGEKHLPGAGAIEETPGSGRAIEGWARITPVGRPPREIHVNAEGERFRAEDDADMDATERALLRQTGHLMWMVFDEAGLDFDELTINRRWSPEEVRRRAAEGNHLWTAPTLAELAEKAGLPAGALERTVAEWNATVERGAGDPFGRRHLAHPLTTAPYYALRCHATPISSAAGITVDGELRVLDAASDPIPNLFAAGEILGAGATMGFAKVGGMMVTPALSLGRVLGRALTAAPVPAAEPA
jgi:fumarate reductase flavoprotein subunit